MKNIQLFGGVVLIFSVVMVLQFFLSTDCHNARIVDPVFVMKDSSLLFSLNDSMQQNCQVDGKDQHARMLLARVSDKLKNGMKI